MNYYDLLGIAPQATLAQIREAYRRLAKQYHPDRFHRLSETAKKYVQEKMLLLNEAYRVLSDPDERQKYDEQNKRKVVSSQDYARYVDLDWKINQLLHEDRYRKGTIEQIRYKSAGQVPLSLLRGIGLPLLFIIIPFPQGLFWCDAFLIGMLIIMSLGAKRTTRLSISSMIFLISWGCLWGWSIFILPSIRFSPTSDMRDLAIFLSVFLFILTQFFYARLFNLFDHDWNHQIEQEFSKRQKELGKLFAELRTLENEFFGSENRPSSQTRYN